MHGTASNMEASNSQQRPFRFFDLSRELRDMVYSYSTHDGKNIHTRNKEDDYDKITVSIEAGPRAALLQVSRQFNSEHIEEVKRHCSLVFTDQNFSGLSLPSFPEQALIYATKVKCLLLSTCNSCRSRQQHTASECANGQNAQEHATWLQELCTLTDWPVILNLVLVVYSQEAQQWPSNFSGAGFAEALQQLVALPSVKTLDVKCWWRDWQGGDEVIDPNIALPSDFIKDEFVEYGTWNREEGWRVEDATTTTAEPSIR